MLNSVAAGRRLVLRAAVWQTVAVLLVALLFLLRGVPHAAAAAVAEPIIAAGYRGFRAEACTYGSPETVAAKFREYAAMGYTDIIIRHLTDDHGQVLGSFRRLAEVRQAVAGA